jgi:esterase/lipase superfamily enzyme
VTCSMLRCAAMVGLLALSWNDCSAQTALCPDSTPSAGGGTLLRKPTTLYFATNRVRLTDGSFGSQVSSLTYGVVTVMFTQPFAMGLYEQMESSLEWSVQSTRILPPDQWATEIAMRFQHGQGWEKSVIVYLHGFANGFQAAVCRAAEMQYRVRYPGTMVLFSWPATDMPPKSQLLTAYQHDDSAAAASVGSLEQVLTLMQQKQVPPDETTLVAHSMGSRLLVEAMQRGASGPYKALAFLAPGVSVTDFMLAAPILKNKAKRTSVYVNRKDQALFASALVHTSPRMGRSTKSSPLFESIDITDATATQKGLHHSDHLANTALYDLLWNVVRNMPADCRAHRGLGVWDQGTHIWTLHPSDAGYEMKNLPSHCALPFPP